jgi:hypothetical protein
LLPKQDQDQGLLKVKGNTKEQADTAVLPVVVRLLAAQPAKAQEVVQVEPEQVKVVQVGAVAEVT